MPVYDDLGLPRDNGATDFNDSARLAGIMAVVDDSRITEKELFRYIKNGTTVERHPNESKYDLSRDQLMCYLAGYYCLGCHIKYRWISENIFFKYINGISKDLVTPSVRNHIALCTGMKTSWIGYQWLKLDIWYCGKFSKIDTEINQLLCLCIVAGPEYVRRFVKANPKWREQINYYWRDSFRNEPEIAKMLIKKIESYL